MLGVVAEENPDALTVNVRGPTGTPASVKIPLLVDEVESERPFTVMVAS